MGGSSSSTKTITEVAEYYMSMHVGVCQGQIDTLHSIRYGGKVAWSGTVTANGSFTINNRNLHGGPKKEGGVAGLAYLLTGHSTQTMPTNLATKLGRTPSTMPGFRNLTSIFFYDGVGVGGGGGVTGGGTGGWVDNDPTNFQVV